MKVCDMTNSFRYSVTFAVAAMALVCGCRRASQVTDNQQVAVKMPENAVNTSCFVRKYEDNGSYYMTRQSQSIDLFAGAMRLSGSEPAGQYSWQLSGASFTELDGRASQAKWLPSEMGAADYCRLVLGCFQAGMVGQSQGASPVRIRGNWAYPAKSEGPLAWYRSAEGSAVADIVTLQCSDGGWYVARGYGYYLTRGAGMLVPAKIEIFKTDAASMSEQMLLSLDYID
jgi:hypothetical protein